MRLLTPAVAAAGIDAPLNVAPLPPPSTAGAAAGAAAAAAALDLLTCHSSKMQWQWQLNIIQLLNRDCYQIPDSGSE